MTFSELREYCLGRIGVVEDFPFGASPNVYKVGGKIFAILSQSETDVAISLKCDPQLAVNLRLSHSEITPGYHLNKVHWNTLDCSKSLSQDFIIGLIELSYTLVAPKIRRKTRNIAK